MRPLLAQSQADAQALVDQLIRDYAAGISNRVNEAKELAELWCLEVDVPTAAKVARAAREALDAPSLQPAQKRLSSNISSSSPRAQSYPNVTRSRRGTRYRNGSEESKRHIRAAFRPAQLDGRSALRRLGYSILAGEVYQWTMPT